VALGGGAVRRVSALAQEMKYEGDVIAVDGKATTLTVKGR